MRQSHVSSVTELLSYAVSLGLIEGNAVSLYGKMSELSKFAGHVVRVGSLVEVLRPLPCALDPSELGAMNVSGLLEYAVRFGLVKDGVVSISENSLFLAKFVQHVVAVGRREAADREEAADEASEELSLQRKLGVLDCGQDDYDLEAAMDRLAGDAVSGTVKAIEKAIETDVATCVGDNDRTCFAVLCNWLGVECPGHFTSPSELTQSDLDSLKRSTRAHVGYSVFGPDHPRNHVLPVDRSVRPGAVNHKPAKGLSTTAGSHGVVPVSEFFSQFGRFFNMRFFSDLDGGDAASPVTTGLAFGSLGQGFGDDSLRGRAQHEEADARPPRVGSVVDGNSRGGGTNITGGVVRSRKRVVPAKSALRTGAFTNKTYATTGVTMFNNVDELFLDTVSREFAQEIMDDLFSRWGLPTEEPATMTYAEDLLWLFIVARTASNKADYDAEFEIPTRSGTVTASFRAFSLLLSDEYGITRRNFSRAVADDLRTYLNKEGNQFIVSRIAQRVGADPQMGDLCFDGSTGCTGLTTAQATFTKVLEGRNLFERDDVIAEGASNRLFQGMSGGVRSVVPR